MDMASVGWRGDGARTWASGSVAPIAADRSGARRKMVLRTMQRRDTGEVHRLPA
jgi:hypothetical protein